ncbi:MAG: hypothetical protein KTR17_07180 [Cellvibrionaceae bacterium]|nr:hypothetical protein [Cellvibrionaceae bacterium]
MGKSDCAAPDDRLGKGSNSTSIAEQSGFNGGEISGHISFVRAILK